jgi:prepilin-type processing-associated H-X9-DG protein
VIFGILGLRDIGRSRDRLGGKGLSVTGIVTGSIGTVGTICLLPLLLLPAVQRVREAAARLATQNNLKQIGLAMHNYHAQNGAFPPATGRASRPGQPGKLSWRVALLPYLEQDVLYQQFHLDEPWDGPNNLRWLKPTPKVFGLPGDADDLSKGLTYYQAVVGSGTVFDPQLPNGCRLPEITDDHSNTIMIVEAAQPVPWTKQDDLTYAPNGPLPQFSSRTKGGFNALFADGSVRFIPGNTPPETIRPSSRATAVRKCSCLDSINLSPPPW